MHTDGDDEKLPIVFDDEDDETSTTSVIDAELEDVTPPSASDTPIVRVTLDLMELNELDNQLVELRRRRLERTQALRAAIAVRKDNAMRLEMAKFERIVARVRRMLDKAEAEEVKLAGELNKLRALAAAMEI